MIYIDGGFKCSTGFFIVFPRLFPPTSVGEAASISGSWPRNEALMLANRASLLPNTEREALGTESKGEALTKAWHCEGQMLSRLHHPTPNRVV